MCHPVGIEKAREGPFCFRLLGWMMSGLRPQRSKWFCLAGPAISGWPSRGSWGATVKSQSKLSVKAPQQEVHKYLVSWLMPWYCPSVKLGDTTEVEDSYLQ